MYIFMYIYTYIISVMCKLMYLHMSHTRCNFNILLGYNEDMLL